MNGVVAIERSGEVAILRLNRPEAMNAVNEGIRRELRAVLGELEADPAVRAVVITGSGDRAFSSGQDLAEAAAVTAADVAGCATGQRALFAAVPGINKPTVAACNGVAAGAGYQIGLY